MKTKKHLFLADASKKLASKPTMETNKNFIEIVTDNGQRKTISIYAISGISKDLNGNATIHLFDSVMDNKYLPKLIQTKVSYEDFSLKLGALKIE